MASIYNRIADKLKFHQQSYDAGVAAGEGYANFDGNEAPLDSGSAIEFIETIEDPSSFSDRLSVAFQRHAMDEQYPIVEDQPVYYDAEVGEYLADTPSTASPDEQAEIVDDHVFEFEYHYSRFVEGQIDVNTLLSENQRIREELQIGYHDVMSQQDTQTALDNYDRRAGPYVDLELEANYPELKEQMQNLATPLEELAQDIANDELFIAYKMYEKGLDPKYGRQIDGFSLDQKNALYEKLAAFKSMALDVASLHENSGIEIPEIQLDENFLVSHHDVESELALDLGDRMYFDNSESNYEARQEMRYALTPPPQPGF